MVETIHGFIAWHAIHGVTVPGLPDFSVLRMYIVDGWPGESPSLASILSKYVGRRVSISIVDHGPSATGRAIIIVENELADLLDKGVFDLIKEDDKDGLLGKGAQQAREKGDQQEV